MRSTLFKKGFSLIELLIVVAIISILTMLFVVNYGEARKQARDELRKVHVDQIAVALRLYQEKTGSLPKESEIGTHQGRIGVGGPLDALLLPYFKELPVDPLSDEDPNTYFYYFDGYHQCITPSGTGVLDTVVYANKMEVNTNGNRQSLCTRTDTEPNFAPQNASANGYYHIYRYTQAF